MPRSIASTGPTIDAYMRAEMGLSTSLLDERSSDDEASIHDGFMRAANMPSYLSSLDTGAALRPLRHLILQSTLYASCTTVGAVAMFGALMAGTLCADHAPAQVSFFERHMVRATALGAIGGALVASGLILYSGIARMNGARSVYYRLAPASQPGDGAVVATLGAVNAGWLIGSAAYLLGAHLMPDVRYVT